MKVVLMKKTPKITDIHQQSMQLFLKLERLYENHKKKLNKIRQDRRSYLGFDNQRASQIQSIRMTKSKSFATKFNQNSKHIQQSNGHMLSKLLQVKNRANTYRTPRQLEERSQSHSLIKTLTKRQMQTTTQQNRKLLDRLEKIQSPLSARKFNSEYLKTEKIKRRIQRYTANDDKISLKSQRSYDNMKKSNVSIQSILQRNRQKTIENQQKIKSFSAKKKTFSFVNHYRKDQILSNKVDFRMDKQISSARRQIKKGGILNNILNDQKMFGVRFKNQGNSAETNSFLTLQPHKKYTLPTALHTKFI